MTHHIHDSDLGDPRDFLEAKDVRDTSLFFGGKKGAKPPETPPAVEPSPEPEVDEPPVEGINSKAVERTAVRKQQADLTTVLDDDIDISTIL